MGSRCTHVVSLAHRCARRICQESIWYGGWSDQMAAVALGVPSSIQFIFLHTAALGICRDLSFVGVLDSG